MSDHADTIERHSDVVVVGGSAAGLAAALQLGRQRRSTIVVDAGEPRDVLAADVHGFLTNEGQPPSELTRRGRDEVRSYGQEVLDGRAVGATRLDDGRFRVELVGGHAIVARRLLLATGLTDVLPDVDGLAERWGRDVIHCPFCHGYEVSDQRVVHLVTHPAGLHVATLVRQLTERLTVVVHAAEGVDEAQLDELRGAGVEVVTAPAKRVVVDAADRLTGIELANGLVVDADAVFVGVGFRANAALCSSLGLETAVHATGTGDVVEVDAMGHTAVPGLYAAGNVTDPSHQMLQAAAHGGRVGAMIAADLADEDLRRASRPSAHAADWDRRYEGRQLWSGDPNGALVQEASGLVPGRALDVGAGEGGDALWLAEQGWKVTANDISGLALDRLGVEADERGLVVERLRADANALDPFERKAFDLVCAQYASIPRRPDGRGIANLLGAVAPGGRLLVVSHDLAPMRAPLDTRTASRAFDPDAYVRVEDVAAALADGPDWEVEVQETRPRPAGAASAAHHVDDVVLRARRRAA